MRLGMSVIIIISILFGAEVRAESVTKTNIRIQDYFVNPATDLAWMTEKERATYIAFIYGLQLLIDAELSEDLVIVVPEKPSKSVKNHSLKHLLNPLLGFQTAHAVAPLVYLAGSAVVRGTMAVAPRVIALARSRAVVQAGANIKHLPAKNMGTAEVVDVTTKAGVQAVKKGGRLRHFVEGSAVFAIADASLSGTDVSEFQEVHGKASQAQAQTQNSQTQSLQASSSKSAGVSSRQKRSATGSGKTRRQEGDFCIFGGHASAYKKFGSRVACPAPKNTINNPLCSESGYSPSFFCQSMGLSENKKVHELSKKLCIPLRGEQGLSDLTVRCSEVFINDFLPSVKAVDPSILKEYQEQLDKGIKEVETKHGVEESGFLEYCQSGNAKNKGLQAGPCGALLHMMEAVRKDLPTVAKNAATKTNSPTPGPPATGDR